MKKLTFFIAMLMFFSSALFAQVGINSDNSAPDASAGLDVKFNNKGFRPPRMTTTQMYAISSPAAGLMVYNTTLNSICWFNGSSWDIGTKRDGKDCGTLTYGGQTYTSVIIGMQCWMAQNLNIGVAIPGSQYQTNNATIEKYCYNNDAANCNVYGGLYQWAEMVQYLNGATNLTSWNPVPTGNVQGICPTGWHLPTDAEWTILTTYLGGESVAGGPMKGLGYWLAPNIGATNSSGFTALPGGGRNDPVIYPIYFDNLTITGRFWSASEYLTASGAWYRNMYYNSAMVLRNGYSDGKLQGFSARCLQD